MAAKTTCDLGKRATATSWGSSGRRFKSCQPDQRKGCSTCGNVCPSDSLDPIMQLLGLLGTTRAAGSTRGTHLSVGQVVALSCVGHGFVPGLLFACARWCA